MARPRAFDDEAVLDAAVRCFWQRGYEATSVRTLADEMGLGGASLYNAFGDKRALFTTALDHYCDRRMRSRLVRLECSLPPKLAIEAFFAEIVERSADDPERKGCLLINSALEVAPHDQELAAVIAGYLEEIRAFFHRCLVAGQADGTVSRAQPAEDLAHHLLAVLLGLRVLARAMPDRSVLESVVRPAIELLGGASAKPS